MKDGHARSHSRRPSTARAWRRWCARRWRTSWVPAPRAATRELESAGALLLPARSRRGPGRAVRSPRDAGDPQVDPRAHRGRADRPALQDQHHAALPRRPRRGEGRRRSPRSTRRCSPSWDCSSSPRARPTSRPSCSAPTWGARSPTRRAPSSTKRIGRSPTLGHHLRRRPVGRGDQPAPARSSTARCCRRWRRAGSPTRPPFFVRRSRVKIMDEIARLVGAEAALFVCGERPGLGFADSLSAYYIYQPAAGATDADREVISNINPRGRAARRGRARRRRRHRAHPAREEVGRRPERRVSGREARPAARSSRARSPCAPSPTPPPSWRAALGSAGRSGARSASSPPPPTTRSSPSLDQGTKASPADVVYAKSFYAGARAPVGAALGRVHRHLRRARSGRDRRRARRLPRAISRTRPGSTASRSRAPRRPVAFFPHVIASVGRYLAPLADVARRQRARLSDRAAARVDRGARRRLQGRAASGSPSGSARRRRPTSAAATWSAICRPARPPRAPSPTPSSTSARAPVAGDAARGGVGRGPLARQPAPDDAAGRFRALDTGERFAEKPDHLTHLLDDASLVPKTHPRIVARGKLDLLQSALLDAQVAADADGARGLVGELGEILELARALVGAEVTDREVPPPMNVQVPALAHDCDCRRARGQPEPSSPDRPRRRCLRQ